MLIDLGVVKNESRRNKLTDGHNLEYISNEATNETFEYIFT